MAKSEFAFAVDGIQKALKPFFKGEGFRVRGRTFNRIAVTVHSIHVASSTFIRASASGKSNPFAPLSVQSNSSSPPHAACGSGFQVAFQMSSVRIKRAAHSSKTACSSSVGSRSSSSSSPKKR